MNKDLKSKKHDKMCIANRERGRKWTNRLMRLTLSPINLWTLMNFLVFSFKNLFSYQQKRINSILTNCLPDAHSETNNSACFCSIVRLLKSTNVSRRRMRSRKWFGITACISQPNAPSTKCSQLYEEKKFGLIHLNLTKKNFLFEFL